MPTYEPQTSYASKIDEDRRFATAQEAAKYDRMNAIEICSGARITEEILASNDEPAKELRRSILYLADLIREGKAPARPEPTQEDFFKAYEEALSITPGFTTESAVTTAKSLMIEIRSGERRTVSPVMITAWRAIGLDGEPTAERIRALRETKP